MKILSTVYTKLDRLEIVCTKYMAGTHNEGVEGMTKICITTYPNK